MPIPQRISLIEAYDNRDVIAWLVRHTEEIKDLQDAVDALPESDKFVLTIGDQTINGTKSFVNKIAAAGGIEADDLVRINADLQVYGDIYQNGSAYDTHAEQLYSTKDYILMRDGAVTALSPGTMSGLEIIKYDGTNNLRLAVDDSGVARVGDVGDEQPLLTRDEAADLIDGAPLGWDASENKAKSFVIEAGQNINITQLSNGISISATGGSGGTWTERAANDDWTDLFEYDGNTRLVMAKKDIYIYYSGKVSAYSPKGMIGYDDLMVYADNVKASGATFTIDMYILINSTRIQSTQPLLNISEKKVTIDATGGTITCSVSNVSESIGKASFKVYIRE